MSFRLLERAAADIPTPDAGKIWLFLDIATGEPSYKDDTGTVRTLIGANGAAGATGSTGATGAAGAVWYSGSGAPSGGLGANGDFYLDTAAGTIYTKSAGSWGSPVFTIGSTPGAHAASHENGGSDEIDVTGLTGLLATAQTPATHAHDAADVTSGVFAIGRLATGTPDGTKFVRDDGTLQTPPGGSSTLVGARVYNNAAISLTTATVTALTFNSERFDSDGFHSTSSNTSRLTVPTGKAGYYYIGGSVEYAANATGVRLTFIRLNATTSLGEMLTQTVTAGGTGTGQNPHAFYYLNDGDYVELCAFQSSGGNLNASSASAAFPEFWMARLGT